MTNMQVNLEDICFKENYISSTNILKLKKFFDETVNDWFSNGPKRCDDWEEQLYGCFDRPLRLERKDNPLLPVIDNLKQDFGDFEIYDGSVRYMNYPFPPHTDVRSSETIMEQRKKHNNGYVFIIPLWWDKEYQPGTAFFNSPPKLDEPMYIEYQSILPAPKSDKLVKNLSIKRLIKWKNPGDLIAWRNYQWHASLTTSGYNYSQDKFCKQFISIETWGVKKYA